MDNGRTTYPLGLLFPEMVGDPLTYLDEAAPPGKYSPPTPDPTLFTAGEPAAGEKSAGYEMLPLP